MAKQEYPLDKVYGLLEPGPVVLLTTARNGRANVMTLSWHTMIEFEPPLIGCILGERDLSRALLSETRQCVINIPTVELVDKVVGCGNCSGRDTDKFTVFGLETSPATCVAPPLLDACYASLECKVVDARMVSRYGLFVLEAVKAWVNAEHPQPKTLHHRGHGEFSVAGDLIHTRSRMR